MTIYEVICYAKGSLKNGGNQQKQDFVNTVIEALEKQIPKKPIIRRYYQGAHAMLPDLDAAECPNCGTWNVGMNEYDVRFDFCIYCGQAIDWSEEVETNGRTN